MGVRPKPRSGSAPDPFSRGSGVEPKRVTQHGSNKPAGFVRRELPNLSESGLAREFERSTADFFELPTAKVTILIRTNIKTCKI